LAVIATLSKGYDLDYIWGQLVRGLARDAADVACGQRQRQCGFDEEIIWRESQAGSVWNKESPTRTQ
jgi:hypothetical protein